MPTTVDATTEIQQKFLAGLEASQKAVVTAVGTWAETMETVFSRLPELAVREPARPTEALESAFGFTEKVLASQREFFSEVFQAALPAARIPASTARAASAASAASSKS